MRNIQSISIACAICGRQKTESGNWFLISENKYEDRLHVWTYEMTKVSDSGTQVLCGPKHVRELVLHWMATGCLDYPFAYCRPNSDSAELETLSQGNQRSRLCEIAVEREGIGRVLRENPLALNTLLDEMMVVLEGEVAGVLEEEFDTETCLATQTVV